MPILLILLIAVLVAQVGFWDTLAALFGALGVVVLFFLVLAAAVVLAGYLLVRRFRR